MPRQLKPGDRIKNYTIEAHLNTGAMANSFAALDSTGKKVFFKSYKSPTCAVKWYRRYVDYQKELKHRLDHHLVGKFCVKLLDQFEFTFGVPTFFQAFEFVHGGEDLEQILTKLRRNPSALDWNQRQILAKVMMAAINQLHEAKIIHGDLKPPNLQLFKDPGIKAGYQLKLIDMDFSILSDIRAPWHGHSAYVGTPGYYSPEHLAGGTEVPEPASDVFTCGLILYELLGQTGHPYRFDDVVQYHSATKAHTAKKPKLLGKIDEDANKTEVLVDLLHKCLSPRAANRPTAKDLHLALNGRLVLPVLPPPPKKVAPPAPIPPTRKGSAKLSNSSGANLVVSVTTVFGKYLLQRFGEDSKYADDLQFTIERRGEDWWIKSSSNSTKNLTLINGEVLESERKLNSGDQLALGSRVVKGKTVMPITVTLS